MGNCGYVNLLADLVKLHGPGALNRPCLISHGRGPQARCKVQAIRDPCRGWVRMAWPPEDSERPQRAHPQTAHRHGRCRRHPQACGAHRHQAAASKPDPRPEVAVGRGGGSRQLRRGRANLLLRLRAAAAWIAARLIPSLSERAGAPRGVRPTEPNSFGPHWVRAATVEHGQLRSPTVAKGSEEPQVVGSSVHAAGMMPAGDSDCGPEGRGFESPRSPHDAPQVTRHVASDGGPA
jgi:hypothetical protein